MAKNWKNALILMRIPFSVYLMPVYWFTLSVSAPDVSFNKSIIIFIILHLFVYPASNGYNSWFDKDESSIGGLKHPPKINRKLFYLVIFFDLLAISFSLLISLYFTLMILTYLLVSKAYSYKRIRLKKYPVTGAMVVVFFQGIFTFITIQSGLGMNTDALFSFKNILMGTVSSLFLAGSYPLTQIYQHKEDKNRGDKTLSIILGIKGSFIFSSLAFIMASTVLIYIYLKNNTINYIYTYIAGTLPIAIYFIRWFLLAIKDQKTINYKNAMNMNMLSSLCLSLIFVIIFLQKLFPDQFF